MKKENNMAVSFQGFHQKVRIGDVALFVSLSMVFPTVLVAQESRSELAASAGNDESLLKAFQALERSANQMDHYVAYGIIASIGGWQLADGHGGNPVSNSYAIRNDADDQTLEVKRAGATVARSKTAT